MIPRSLRWAACVAVVVLAPLLSGCLIEGPAKPPAYYSYLKIQPDYNLEAAPAGRIYELWAVSMRYVVRYDTVYHSGDTLIVNARTIAEPGVPKSVVRFQWDPELYLARGENDSISSITSDPGLDVGFNLADFGVLLLSIEPLDDASPTKMDGPVLMMMYLNTEFPSNRIRMVNPFQFIYDPNYGGQPAPSIAYTLISQSNKKGKPGANWRDGSEGYGVWFCVPTVTASTTLDYEGAFDTYSQIFVPPAPDSPFIYTVWISAAHPESSFCNFGRVFGNLEPDINFLDSVAQHADTMKMSATSVLRLGEEPIYIGDTLVGYRYYSGDMRDTCDLRVDHPVLTRCNRDTFDSLVFDVQVTTPRQFTLSQGDTTASSTIGLIDLSFLRNFAQIEGDTTFGRAFNGWEYEAWLVFDKSSGIKPMSMGRFERSSGFDSNNKYCNAAGFDSNFAFPGEDFLRNLSQHDPRLTDSLNVIADPRVKKLWITIEPRNDPAHGYVDWAPDEPFVQLIGASSWFPNAQTFDTVKGVIPDVTRTMSALDHNPGPESLNEGHFWPTMQVVFKQAPTE